MSPAETSPAKMNVCMYLLVILWPHEHKPRLISSCTQQEAQFSIVFNMQPSLCAVRVREGCTGSVMFQQRHLPLDPLPSPPLTWQRLERRRSEVGQREGQPLRARSKILLNLSATDRGPTCVCLDEDQLLWGRPAHRSTPRLLHLIWESVLLLMWCLHRVAALGTIDGDRGCTLCFFIQSHHCSGCVVIWSGLSSATQKKVQGSPGCSGINSH